MKKGKSGEIEKKPDGPFFYKKDRENILNMIKQLQKEIDDLIEQEQIRKDKLQITRTYNFLVALKYKITMLYVYVFDNFK